MSRFGHAFSSVVGWNARYCCLHEKSSRGANNPRVAIAVIRCGLLSDGTGLIVATDAFP
jgi:hypothetical protein